MSAIPVHPGRAVSAHDWQDVAPGGTPRPIRERAQGEQRDPTTEAAGQADFDRASLVVYQAYSDRIADAALAAGTFVPPFKLERMTWIKPSFRWMMYRSGWATKPGQERVLAVRITREGFEDALGQACLSHFDPDVHESHEQWRQLLGASSVRVQWDPERQAGLAPLPWRSLQVGLSGEAVRRYIEDWLVRLDDITPLVNTLRDDPSGGDTIAARERPYPLPESISRRIGASRSAAGLAHPVTRSVSSPTGARPRT